MNGDYLGDIVTAAIRCAEGRRRGDLIGDVQHIDEDDALVSFVEVVATETPFVVPHHIG